MSIVCRNLPIYRRNDRESPFPDHVQALQIRDLKIVSRGLLVIPMEPNFPPFEMTSDWVETFKPEVRGYIVWEPQVRAYHRNEEDFRAEFSLIEPTLQVWNAGSDS